MNALMRLFGIGLLTVALVGVGRAVADPPDLHLGLPSLPAFDNRPHLTFEPGMRLAFDEPTSWNVPSGYTAAVWPCNGDYYVIAGPTELSNVCALALYS